MKKTYQISKKEFKAIKEAITETLNLWQYDFIEAKSYSGHSMSMNKDTFFESLKREFIIK